MTNPDLPTAVRALRDELAGYVAAPSVYPADAGSATLRMAYSYCVSKLDAILAPVSPDALIASATREPVPEPLTGKALRWCSTCKTETCWCLP